MANSEWWVISSCPSLECGVQDRLHIYPITCVGKKVTAPKYTGKVG